jgi:glycosyltransferase involved in cell wall biosynthesis
MNIGILLPGFSSDQNDWAIPVQLNLVPEMARHDDVRVLALRYPHRRDRYSVYGAEVHSLGVGQVRGVGRMALWWEAIHILRRLHREKPFDVLHAMWADETGLVAAWAGRWLGVPVVVSVAGGELVGFDAIGYGLQRGAFSRWTVGQALMSADAVVVACSYAKNLITQAGYAIPYSKIHTITLGVDINIFCPGTESPISNRLIHVGSLVGVKDQATLLRALAKLGDATLDILGTGPEQANLELLASRLGIRERLNFIGAVHHLDLPQYYRRAALNVLTSRHEGLGMVTLEAGACRVPTVSTNVGLLPDILAMGAVVPVGNDAALANAIQNLLSDENRRLEIGAAARQIVSEKFTIQHTVAQFRALYKQL